MASHKFPGLLDTFQPKEFRRLREWVHAPFINKNKDISAFCDILTEIYPQQGWKPEEIYKAAFPGKPYDDLRCRHLSSILYKLCEEMLTWEKHRNNKPFQQLTLMECYQERGLGKNFQSVSRALTEMLESNPTEEEDYYRFTHEKLCDHSIEKQQNRALAPNVEETSFYLDRFYLLEKLKLICTAKSTRKLMNKPFAIDLEPELLEMAGRLDPKANPLVRAYYLVALLEEENPEEGLFTELLSILQAHGKSWKEEVFKELMVYARNHCIRKVNRGVPDFFRPLLELYKMELPKDTGMISPYMYKNIVTVALNLDEVEFTDRFIHTYRRRVDTGDENLFHFGLAKLHFARKEYRKAIKSLSRVDYNEYFLEIDGRILLLKCLFELGDRESAESQAVNLATFIRRLSITPYHKTFYLNFLKGLRTLLKFKVSAETSEKIAGLTMAEKKWIVQKLEQAA